MRILKNECRDSYPLLEYDLFTIWNLAYSRQENKSKLLDKYFFYSQDENEMEIYEHIKEILDKYIKNYCDVRISMAEEKEYDKEKIMNNFDITGISYQKRPLERILKHLKELNIETKERYVHCFFKVIRKMFSE